jgi:hypothetical protein
MSTAAPIASGRRALHEREAVQRRRTGKGDADCRVGPPRDVAQRCVPDGDDLLRDFQESDADADADGADDGLPLLAPCHVVWVWYRRGR